MSKPQLLQYDTRDDRTEIHRLLCRLPPRRRVAFVESCCRAATMRRAPVRPAVKRATWELAERAMVDDSVDGRLSLECFLDLCYIGVQYQFDLDRALLRLVEMVRKPNFAG